MIMDYPWLCVSGFGAHIKSTQKKLIIQKKNTIEEYPLESVKNLMIVGGHTINSATILNLVKKGSFISFFEPNGTPAGIIRPFGENGDDPHQKIQQEVSRHRYVTEIAQASSRARVVYATGIQEIQKIFFSTRVSCNFSINPWMKLHILSNLKKSAGFTG